MYIDTSNIDKIKIIIQAENIKDGTVVTKITGKKEYIIRRNIKIYGDNRKEIKCDDGFIFLVDSNGNIDMISNDKELLVQIEPEDLMYDIANSLEEDK